MCLNISPTKNALQNVLLKKYINGITGIKNNAYLIFCIIIAIKFQNKTPFNPNNNKVIKLNNSILNAKC